MSSVTSRSTGEGRHGRRTLGFVSASVALLGAYIASGTPVSLYETYRESGGVTTGDLSVAAVGYFAAAITALLVCSRLSDHLGRRPVVLASLALASLGCLVLLHVTGPEPLIVGRALQGFACGIASSAAAAFVVDNAPARPGWLGPVIAGSAPMAGIVGGALISGALVEYGPDPTRLSYLVALALLGAGIAFTAVSSETVSRQSGALASLRPQVRIPRRSWRLLPSAAAVFFGTWALGGYDQAFGPTVAHEGLGSDNAFVGSIVFASLMAFGPLGGPLTARIRPAAAQRGGMLVFALAVAGMALALHTGHAVWFIVASAVAGISGLGAAFNGGVRALLSHSSLHERAGVLASIFAIAYSGSALPALAAGRLAHAVSLDTITTGYAVLAALCAAVVICTATETTPATRPAAIPDSTSTTTHAR